MTQILRPLTVYLPDTRSVVLSRFGRGNAKIGMTVFTYSRMPGHSGYGALGTYREGQPLPDPISTNAGTFIAGTCPGATEECQKICYARRPVQELGPVFEMWLRNGCDDVPPIPDDCRLLRIHVSGDFDTVPYIFNWIVVLKGRPDVTCWAYTRSWRVPDLLPMLEELRALPNVQLFASMDKSHTDEPPAGWRRAWIDGDLRAGTPHLIHAHEDGVARFDFFETQVTDVGTKALICPEETKVVKDCENCGFCFKGQRNDVVFLEH